MKYFSKTICILCFAFAFISCQKISDEINITFNINNSMNGYEYKIEVIQKNSKPADFVIFVLDPSSMLSKVFNEYQTSGYNINIAFVGIGYDGRENNRNRDYSPTNVGSGTGEADYFLKFLTGQLFEELISKNVVKPDSETGIIGHSLGGLAAGYAFCNHNEFFNNYIILSPVFFYDDYVIFEIEESKRESNLGSQAKVYLGIGDMEDFGMANGFEGFVSVIQQYYTNVNLDSRSIKGGHMSTIKDNIHYGLKHILE